jgi:hypothetical protein
MVMANLFRELLLWASQEKKIDFDKGCEPLVHEGKKREFDKGYELLVH